MRTVKKIQTGEVYRVREINGEDFIGILISKSIHLNKESPFLLFYTYHNEEKEFYETEAAYFKDNTIDTDIISLLKDYYNETAHMYELNKEINRLYMEKGMSRKRKDDIAERLSEITGFYHASEIKKYMEQQVEEPKDDLKMIAETAKNTMDAIKDTMDIVKQTKKVQKARRHLGDMFDDFYDYMDKRASAHSLL